MPTNWCLLRVHNNNRGAKMNRLLRVFSWGACYPPIELPIGGAGSGMRTGWGLYLNEKSRFGLDMYGRHLAGATKTIRNGIFINPNTAPPRIRNLVSRIFLWSFIWKEGRTLFSKTNQTVRYNRFFKYISLRIIKGAINYVRRKGAYSKSPQMGYGHYEGKGLVCSLLGVRVRGWSFNTSTLY